MSQLLQRYKYTLVECTCTYAYAQRLLDVLMFMFKGFLLRKISLFYVSYVIIGNNNNIMINALYFMRRVAHIGIDFKDYYATSMKFTSDFVSLHLFNFV